MKRSVYFLLGIVLAVSGAPAADEEVSAEREKPIEVRTVVKTHESGYETHKPGATGLLKRRGADMRKAVLPKPEVLHIPKQEASDEA